MIRFIKLTVDNNFGVEKITNLRINIEDIACYYTIERDVIKREMGAMVKNPRKATIVYTKQESNFYVKETPEEIDKLIDPVTYYAKIERGDPFEIKEDK